jgi:Filamin/ABP280 repeat
MVTGEPTIKLTNEQGLTIMAKIIDNKDRTYRVEFEATSIGTYTATVTFSSQPVPGSPFKITVVPSIDVGKVQVKGLPESKSHRHFR